MAALSVFVTVGTTQFDKLIRTVLNRECINVLAKRGFGTLVLQIGHGKEVPDSQKCGIKIHSFSLKPNILEEILEADLVISHAGAGTCLTVLNASKPLVVVVNEELMDNHQTELADKLEEEGYLFKSNCDNLACVLENVNFNSLNTFIPGNAKIYANYIDNAMGF